MTNLILWIVFGVAIVGVAGWIYARKGSSQASKPGVGQSAPGLNNPIECVIIGPVSAGKSLVLCSVRNALERRSDVSEIEFSPGVQERGSEIDTTGVAAPSDPGGENEYVKAKLGGQEYQWTAIAGERLKEDDKTLSSKKFLARHKDAACIVVTINPFTVDRQLGLRALRTLTEKVLGEKFPLSVAVDRVARVVLGITLPKLQDDEGSKDSGEPQDRRPPESQKATGVTGSGDDWDKKLLAISFKLKAIEKELGKRRVCIDESCQLIGESDHQQTGHDLSEVFDYFLNSTVGQSAAMHMQFLSAVVQGAPFPCVAITHLDVVRNVGIPVDRVRRIAENLLKHTTARLDQLIVESAVDLTVSSDTALEPLRISVGPDVGGKVIDATIAVTRAVRSAA